MDAAGSVTGAGGTGMVIVTMSMTLPLELYEKEQKGQS